VGTVATNVPDFVQVAVYSQQKLYDTWIKVKFCTKEQTIGSLLHAKLPATKYGLQARAHHRCSFIYKIFQSVKGMGAPNILNLGFAAIFPVLH